MALFKRDVNIYCKDMEQLGRLLTWIRDNSGLSSMNKETWEVHAILPGILNEDQTLKGFWVSVPYDLAVTKIKKVSKQEAFADILNP